MLQGLGLTQPIERIISADILEKQINFFENAFIGLLPVEIIFPRSRSEEKIHSNSDSFFNFPFPASS